MDTEKVADLIAELRGFAAGSESARASLMRDAADALEAVTAERDRFYEGLYQAYVQLGEDTDGARNADELFRPMVNCDPAEWVPRLVANYRAEMEAEADAIEAERDEALSRIPEHPKED